VSDLAVLADALNRIAEGECVIDPTIVARPVMRPPERTPLDDHRRVLAVLIFLRS
jgi:hypothetical protein